MIFSLNDMFEFEEFDDPPPDYYIIGEKMQLLFWGLFPRLFLKTSIC